MGLKIDQLENCWGKRKAGFGKRMKGELNRKVRRASKLLDKKVLAFNDWYDNDEEGNFSPEADYQYPSEKQFCGWEY
jgi:hypothetical protein